MITTKMNVTDSTESTDTMTVINNEQSIIVIVYFLLSSWDWCFSTVAQSVFCAKCILRSQWILMRELLFTSWIVAS